MEREAIHELTAAYALDALDDADLEEFEQHLRRCAPCRQEVADLQASAAALAFATDGPAPPPALRERIMAQAREEPSNVVSFPRRNAFRLAAAAAAVAACAALGLGIWAASLSAQLGDLRAEQPSDEALAVLADAGASHVALEGAAGTLVVAPSGEAALVLQGLERLAEGSYYTVWVSRGEAGMAFAGSFRPGDRTEVVPLAEPVPEGEIVAVTVEGRPDAPEPSSDPIIVSNRT